MRQFFCVVCDAVNLKPGSLCSFCIDKVTVRSNDHFIRDFEGVPHYFLFEWTLESDTFCRNLVYFLKNKKASCFLEWTSCFPVDELGLDDGDCAVVPGLSSQGRYNHARGLAEAFEKLLPLSCVIEIGAQKSPQKAKNRAERLSLKGVRARLDLDMDWVFVDDVFVTGGTYKRIVAAVGKKPKMILTLFNRPLFEEF